MGTAQLQEVAAYLEQGEMICRLIGVEMNKPAPDEGKIEAWLGEVKEIFATTSCSVLDSLA